MQGGMLNADGLSTILHSVPCGNDDNVSARMPDAEIGYARILSIPRNGLARAVPSRFDMGNLPLVETAIIHGYAPEPWSICSNVAGSYTGKSVRPPRMVSSATQIYTRPKKAR